MMPTLEFGPLGVRTSRVGLGCARLVGRDTLHHAAAIVEAALDLGVRYFDVAPSYGMGTAEEVLGEVLGDAQDVVVATKFGIARPAYSRRTNLARRYVKPMLDRSRTLKALARRVYVVPQPGPRPRFDYSAGAVRRSLTESLRRLRRSRADVLLAHEPRPEDLNDELAGVFRDLRAEGLIGAWGVGLSAVERPWATAGEVWQSGWPADLGPYVPGPALAFHGVVRAAARDARGRLLTPAPRLLREAVTAAPGAVVLVSAATPARLRELLSEVRR